MFAFADWVERKRFSSPNSSSVDTLGVLAVGAKHRCLIEMLSGRVWLVRHFGHGGDLQGALILRDRRSES